MMMATVISNIKRSVAALSAMVMFSLPAAAQTVDGAEGLLAELRAAETEVAANRLERQIINAWSKSGSPARDLLLKRGRDAIEVGDIPGAIEHLQALTDHAPGFAEGWHTLALAYFQADRLGLAMNALEHTLVLNPDHFIALKGVGAIHERTGNPELAYAAYERVLELRPHDPEIEQAIARLAQDVKGTAL